MKKTVIYPVVAAALKRERITIGDMAKEIGIARETLSRKLSGKKTFTLEEAQKIRGIVEPTMTLDEVFNKK